MHRRRNRGKGGGCKLKHNHNTIILFFFFFLLFDIHTVSLAPVHTFNLLPTSLQFISPSSNFSLQTRSIQNVSKKKIACTMRSLNVSDGKVHLPTDMLYILRSPLSWNYNFVRRTISSVVKPTSSKACTVHVAIKPGHCIRNEPG